MPDNDVFIFWMMLQLASMVEDTMLQNQLTDMLQNRISLDQGQVLIQMFTTMLTHIVLVDRTESKESPDATP